MSNNVAKALGELRKLNPEVANTLETDILNIVEEYKAEFAKEVECAAAVDAGVEAAKKAMGLDQ